MPSLNPHIRFDGSAREALGFYRAVFGGEATIVEVGDRPETGLPPEAVFHAELRCDGFTLLLADHCPQEPRGTERISLHVRCTDAAEIQRFTIGLSSSGTIRCDLGPAFGGLYAEVTDRFGIHWFLTSPA